MKDIEDPVVGSPSFFKVGTVNTFGIEERPLCEALAKSMVQHYCDIKGELIITSWYDENPPETRRKKNKAPTSHTTNVQKREIPTSSRPRTNLSSEDSDEEQI
jgi:hypothetical protein